ncbi:hypothetical protein PR003_g1353 [Phytophthora rubi]|uniref:Secreted protein n=1 Tax=Phytophthora rubi TaxID=129364 RepID=A0A6A3PDL7_9STRA|nr:hypothetical protein PR002_g1319 [Phytophthora rubi]KAE9051678.1 hypothetical protein PR001_g1227 [Phytophthora rubi]KAE9358354.1 hypothetical protein PR003_g1353 [Phytophthora rubi]
MVLVVVFLVFFVFCRDTTARKLRVINTNGVTPWILYFSGVFWQACAPVASVAHRGSRGDNAAYCTCINK